MKTILKGMSPDLFDNVILMCGSMIYDCHRMLRDDAGVMRKALEASDMMLKKPVMSGISNSNIFLS